MSVEPQAQRRYFISHTGADKQFAIALRDALEGPAWVDLFEISVGDVLLDRIAEGIENATDFVLLWSAASAASKWVRFEFHMAFIRHLEDNAIAIRILCLDDTPVPLPFRPFLQGRDVKTVEEATLLLTGAAPRAPVLRAFVNRNSEIDAVESALYAPRVGHLWLWGMNGVGKRSVAREALRRIVGDPTKTLMVEIRAGTRFAELDLLLAAALGSEPPPAESDEDQARGRVETAVEEFASVGGIWVFAEAQHWLEEDGTPGLVLASVLAALTRAGTAQSGRTALFTTSKRASLSGDAAAEFEAVHMRGLRANFGVALLRARGADAPDETLRHATEQLDGHPLALEIVAQDLPQDDAEWEDFRARAATGVVSDLRLDDSTSALLERVAAVDGPLPAQDYAEHLGLDDAALQQAVETATAYSLVEPDRGGYLRLHPLLRDFFMRGFRRREHFMPATSDLADRANARLESLDPGSALYVDTLLMTFRLLCWAGRLSEALAIRANLYGTLFETAVELYNQRRYGDARRYFELVIEGSADDREARLYLARTLAYLSEISDARAIIDALVDESPDDYHLWRIRGRVEYIARAFESAISYYERANELRAGVPAVLRDLGQARMRVGDFHGARAALAAAMERQRRDPDPYLAFQYSQVLEHFGEYEEARRLTEQAIRRDPQNAGFRHRLGRISEALGDREVARREYEASLALEPDFAESLLSLASMAADDGDLTIARANVERARRLRTARKVVVHNVEAKIELRGGDIDGARDAIDKALAEDPDVPTLGLAARIEFEAMERGLVRCSDVSGRIRQFAERIRVGGDAQAADEILERLADACP